MSFDGGSVSKLKYCIYAKRWLMPNCEYYHV